MKIKDLRGVLHLHVIMLIDLPRLYPASCYELHSRIGTDEITITTRKPRSIVSRSWILMNCRQINFLLRYFYLMQLSTFLFIRVFCYDLCQTVQHRQDTVFYGSNEITIL